MYIREITLENVRGFTGARNVSLELTRSDGSLAGWTVLAGRNGSGETSLLRAIALAIGGRAESEAVNRYEQLRELLTSSPTARVDELAARLMTDTELPRP